MQDPIAEAVRQEHVRAVAEYKRSDDRSAIARYRRVLCADPGDRLATENFVWLATRDDMTSALGARVGRWAVRKFPDNMRVKYLTGRTLFWRGEIGAAIPLLGATATQGPDPERAYSMLGHALTLRLELSDMPSLGAEIPAANGPRLVAFARDMISLDHLLPVICRWSEMEHRDALIVLIGSVSIADWRIAAARAMPRVYV